MVALLISFGNHSNADEIKLAWDESTGNDLENPWPYEISHYLVTWGPSENNYINRINVGNVLEAVVNIPIDSWIAAIAVDIKGNESDLSNFVIYGTDLPIQSASGGSIDIKHVVNEFKETLRETILIRETAVYYIWLRVLSPSMGKNSFYITIDNQNEQVLHTPVFLEWEWFKYKEINFNEGAHDIVIRVREQRTQLDKICVTSDPEFMPIGKMEKTETDNNYWFEAEEMEINYPFELGYDENASNGAFVWSLQSSIK